MDLFNTGEIINLLPFDGCALYYGVVFSRTEADAYFLKLHENIAWKHDEALMFGKRIVTARKVAWYGEKPYSYTYSNTIKTALPWTVELRELKSRTEEITGHRYNSCLINLYHHGGEGMAWHSDNEKTLKKHGAIASLSFGAARKFAFRHKNNGRVCSLFLEHGSLILMKENTQENWLHRLPPTKSVKGLRINLTFRSIVI